MSAPDFQTLRSVGSELRTLANEGRLTKAEYDRLLSLASAAVGKHTEFLEGILMRGVTLGYVTP